MRMPRRSTFYYYLNCFLLSLSLSLAALKLRNEKERLINILLES